MLASPQPLKLDLDPKSLVLDLDIDFTNSGQDSAHVSAPRTTTPTLQPPRGARSDSHNSHNSHHSQGPSSSSEDDYRSRRSSSSIATSMDYDVSEATIADVQSKKAHRATSVLGQAQETIFMNGSHRYSISSASTASLRSAPDSRKKADWVEEVGPKDVVNGKDPLVPVRTSSLSASVPEEVESDVRLVQAKNGPGLGDLETRPKEPILEARPQEQESDLEIQPIVPDLETRPESIAALDSAELHSVKARPESVESADPLQTVKARPESVESADPLQTVKARPESVESADPLQTVQARPESLESAQPTPKPLLIKTEHGPTHYFDRQVRSSLDSNLSMLETPAKHSPSLSPSLALQPQTTVPFGALSKQGRSKSQASRMSHQGGARTSVSSVASKDKDRDSVSLHRGSFSFSRRKSMVVGGLPPVTSSSGIDTDSATAQEIERLREAIVAQRDAKRRRRELQDDDRVLVGTKVSEGHVNYVTAYNMLTGIRVSVSRCNAKMDHELTDADFSYKNKLAFDVSGNELTPSARYDFKFKDYAPWVFRSLRAMFKLDPADYLMSLTSKYIVSELGSPGKSGSFFYFSRDYKYIIKTIHHAEHRMLRRVLKHYYYHVKAHPDTLISQFYGLHRVKMPFGRKIHFIVMNNLFPPHRDIHWTYDLKGSTLGRFLGDSGAAAAGAAAVVAAASGAGAGASASASASASAGTGTGAISGNEDAAAAAAAASASEATASGTTGAGSNAGSGAGERRSIVYKDLNWIRDGRQIKLGPTKRSQLIHQLELDVALLQRLNIMDYSLLIGIHDISRGNRDNIRDATLTVFEPDAKISKAKAAELRRALSVASPTAFSGLQVVFDEYLRRGTKFYGDNGGLRATDENDEPLGDIYYLGVIDCLTRYTTVKKIETFVKGLSHPRGAISAVPAQEYGERFLKFIKSAISPPPATQAVPVPVTPSTPVTPALPSPDQRRSVSASTAAQQHLPALAETDSATEAR